MTYVFWLILAIGFTIIEFGTVSLISIWFVGGALAALITSLLSLELWVQIVVFVAVSALLLLLLRPFLKRFVNPHKVKTNVDALIGQRAMVTQTIDNLAAIGEVRLGGNLWTARSVNDAAIAVGSVVTVRSVEGVKLMVAPEKAGTADKQE